MLILLLLFSTLLNLISSYTLDYSLFRLIIIIIRCASIGATTTTTTRVVLFIYSLPPFAMTLLIFQTLIRCDCWISKKIVLFLVVAVLCCTGLNFYSTIKSAFFFHLKFSNFGSIVRVCVTIKVLKWVHWIFSKCNEVIVQIW